LFFTTIDAPVYYGFSQLIYSHKVPEFPRVGDTFRFQQTLLAKFVAAGFVHVSK